MGLRVLVAEHGVGEQQGGLGQGIVDCPPIRCYHARRQFLHALQRHFDRFLLSADNTGEFLCNDGMGCLGRWELGEGGRRLGSLILVRPQHS